MKYKIAIALILGAQVLANDYQINHSHLNELVGDSEAVFKPVEVEELNLSEDSKLDGVRKRFIITYSQINYSNIDSSYNVSHEDESIYDLDSENLNQMFEDRLELVNGHKISVEYFVTDNFSIELADVYRKYQMDGRHVGRTKSDGFFEESESNIYQVENETILNDIQLGIKYAIRLVDTPEFKVDLSPGMSAGLVHVNTTTRSYYNGQDNEESHYNDIGGYSYGVSLEAKATFWDSFFIAVGVEQRNYVMAPMSDDNGFSQQIDQSGVNFFIGGGIKF